MSASLAVGFSILEHKSVKETRVFAVIQSIIGILFWVKAFSLDGAVKVHRKSTSKRGNPITNVMDSIESEFTGKLNRKEEDGEFIEEAIKRVQFIITSAFAKSGGTKKIRVNGIIVSLDIPSNARDKQKIYVENYNSEGDDLEVTLSITEKAQ